MESNIVNTLKLYDAYKDEYEVSSLPWIKFFNSKHHETGVVVTDYSFVYKVIDEQKWFLTKIKYGI